MLLVDRWRCSAGSQRRLRRHEGRGRVERRGSWSWVRCCQVKVLVGAQYESVKITCCKEQSLVAPQQRQQEFWRSPTLHLGSSAVEQNHPGQENLIVKWQNWKPIWFYWGENSPNHECTVPSLRNCRMYPAPNVASVLIADIDINLKTLYWETAVSQSAGLASTSEREMRISHNN